MKEPTCGWNKKARDAWADLQAIADAYGRGDVVLKRYHTGALSRINTAFRDACYASERRHGGRNETGDITTVFDLETLPQDIKRVRAWLKNPLGYHGHGHGFVAQLESRHRYETAEPRVRKGIRAVLADVSEWLPVARFVQKLPAPQEAKPVYTPPKASRAAMRRVHRLLTDLVERYRLDVEKAIAKNMRAIVKEFVEKHGNRSPYVYFEQRAYSWDVVHNCLQGRSTRPYGPED
jgi:hypothetical protein